MRLKRGPSIFIGGILAAGCAAALIAAGMTSGSTRLTASALTNKPSASAKAAAPAALAKAASPVKATVPTKGAASASGSASASASKSTSTSAAASAATVVSASSVANYGNPKGTASVPAAGRAVNISHPNHVIGHGTPASCTSAAVVKAVAEGGITTFNCGPKPVVITMTATAKVFNTSHEVVLDGGGKVTLSGGAKVQIIYMNTCDEKQRWSTSHCYEQEWPQLVVQNLKFVNAYSGTQEYAGGEPWYGGGAIFDEGGQLKVVNSAFIDDRCYQYGGDVSGGAIRAYAMYQGVPTYITDDTFTGNACSNGGALGGLHANFDVLNSMFTNNRAIGWGGNPYPAGTPGGGSGGAIFTDGVGFNTLVDGTIISNNSAREGAGAIFETVHFHPGSLKIEYSTLHHNTDIWANAPGVFYNYNSVVLQPTVIDSTLN